MATGPPRPKTLFLGWSLEASATAHLPPGLDSFLSLPHRFLQLLSSSPPIPHRLWCGAPQGQSWSGLLSAIRPGGRLTSQVQKYDVSGSSERRAAAGGRSYTCLREAGPCSAQGASGSCLPAMASPSLGFSDSRKDCSAHLASSAKQASQCGQECQPDHLPVWYVSLPILSFFRLTLNFFLFFLARYTALWSISWASGLLESCIQCPGKPTKKPRVGNGA